MREGDTIPPEAYDADYFLSECEGHEEYTRTGGRSLPRRLETALDLVGAMDGLRVLDLGCGRGEMLRHCPGSASSTVGIDFSRAALALSKSVSAPNANLLQANVQRLPFADRSFDLIFALDLVEHLYPVELEEMLSEVHRVLAPGGRLLVHTMPNAWYYRFGYPAFRLLQRLRGQHLPADPRDRSRRVHVNVQSISTLAQSLREPGFTARVWLHNTQGFESESRALRPIFRFVATVRPFAWVFCNDLFAIATRERS